MQPIITVVGNGLVANGLVAGLRQRDVTAATADSVTPGADAYVWVSTVPGTPQPLVSLTADEWAERCEAPLRSFVTFMQDAHAALQHAGGSIVVVIPTIAMTGAAGLAPWAAVADGQRALAKSAARVWGTKRITVNCLAVPAALLAGGNGDISRPDLQQSALPEPHLGEVAGVVAALCQPDLAVISGATLGVDGGRWMNP